MSLLPSFVSRLSSFVYRTQENGSGMCSVLKDVFVSHTKGFRRPETPFEWGGIRINPSARCVPGCNIGPHEAGKRAKKRRRGERRTERNIDFFPCVTRLCVYPLSRCIGSNIYISLNFKWRQEY